MTDSTEKTPHPYEPDSVWSPPAGGGAYVWLGKFTCTEADIDALNNSRKGRRDPDVQESTLCGVFHPKWISQWYAEQPPERRPGGAGSPAFEAQYCGRGVFFTKTEIWYLTKDGSDMIMGIPPNEGAYHQRYDGDGFLNIEGPEPGSDAAGILGTRAYHWDEELGLYQPGPDKIVPWWD